MPDTPQHTHKRTHKTQLVISPKLRSQDAGTLLFGSIPTAPEINTTTSLLIPPGQRRFDFIDYCPSSCTKVWCTKDIINMKLKSVA